MLFVVTSMFNYSMKYVSASMSGVIIYLGIPVSYLLDYLLFDHEVGFVEMVGVFIIVVVNVLLGYLKSKGLVS